MAKLLLPLLLALIGAGAGVGAGFYLRPPPTEAEAPDAAGEDGEPDAAAAAAVDEYAAADEDLTTRPLPDRDRPPLAERDFVRINNQFIVPVLSEGRVEALVVVSLSLEMRTGLREIVFAREPKLRDALLQVMFDHANAGGFSGNFTSSAQVTTLRRSLWEAARPILGPDVYDVLITDIARQDT